MIDCFTQRNVINHMCIDRNNRAVSSQAEDVG
jgi:hypothetical protein